MQGYNQPGGMNTGSGVVDLEHNPTLASLEAQWENHVEERQKLRSLRQQTEIELNAASQRVYSTWTLLRKLRGEQGFQST